MATTPQLAPECVRTAANLAHATSTEFTATNLELDPATDKKTALQKKLWAAASRAVLITRLAAMPQLELDKSGRIANYHVVGGHWRDNVDWFHALLNMSWFSLLILLFLVYTTIAILFALLYQLQPGCIRSAEDGYADAFYFSLQTLSTAGYGYLSPQTTYANLLTLLESFCGLGFVATFTGLLYSRVSRPNARVAFTKFLVVHDIDGVPTLMLRVCNQRATQILESKAQVSVLMKHSTVEGEVNYQYKSLKLDEVSIPIFSGGWRLKHALTRDSPLFGISEVRAPPESAAARSSCRLPPRHRLSAALPEGPTSAPS